MPTNKLINKFYGGDMEAFWKEALKYNAGATVAGLVFWLCLSKVLDKALWINSNPRESILLVLIIFNFCALLVVWFSPRKKDASLEVSGNEVIGNEVGGGIDIGSQSGETTRIKDNKVEGNSVGGGINIGAKGDE